MTAWFEDFKADFILNFVEGNRWKYLWDGLGTTLLITLLSALMGIVIPSFTVILVVAMLFADIRHNPYVDAAFKGMRPAVVALIVAPVFKLAKGMHRVMYLLIVVTAVAIHWLGLSPIYLLIAAAVGGIAWELSHLKKLKQ